MDEFGYEPRHARVVEGEVKGDDTAAAVEAEGAVTGTGTGAGAEADSATAAAPDVADSTQSSGQQQGASTSSRDGRPSSSKQKPASEGLKRNMPRPKAAQASAQNAPPADDRDDPLHVHEGEPEESVPLPQAFTAQYLGSRPASGLWGVRHTRRPVDEMVAAARASPAPLPWQRVRVSAAGVAVFHASDTSGGSEMAASGGRRTGAGGQAAVAVRALRVHDIAAISYGVQDLVYTRIFCFIVVTDQRAGASQVAAGVGPESAPVFQCHAYVCESRAAARALTHALAAAFRAFSRELRRAGPGARSLAKNRFKIELRSPEQLAAEIADSSDA